MQALKIACFLYRCPPKKVEGGCGTSISIQNVLHTLFFLAEQNTDIFFDCNTRMEELGIDRANAEQIVEGLLHFALVVKAKRKRAGEDEVIYQYRLDCNLISFLTFAHILINWPQNFSVRMQNRDTLYFQNATYKK